MNRREFGFDTGESLHDELIAARSLIDHQSLDHDNRYLKLSVSSKNLFATIEYFIQIISQLKPDLAAKLFQLVSVRKAAFGLDSVALVKTATYGIALNDYELSLLNRSLSGDLFAIIDLKKDNRSDSFMMINKPAVKAVMEHHRDDFDDFAKADPVSYIAREIAQPLRRGEQPGKAIQYGLLSGFPRESVRLYPYFDSYRRAFPDFSQAYMMYISGNYEANNVYAVIENLPVPEKDKNFLRSILAEHARFHDRSIITAGDFVMLNSSDLHYAKRREHWFHHLDSVYKPIVRNAGYSE